MDISKFAKRFLQNKKIKSKTDGALVGGSYTRGNPTPQSDIDILLVYKNKYKNEFEKVHSKEIEFEGFRISLIFQSEKNIKFYLKNPDPSIISFLRDSVIVHDPSKKLHDWINKAKLLKIYQDEKSKKESKRRLKERVTENVRRINIALQEGNEFLATYLLRGILDEITEKLRMYDEDWLYTQRKSNIKYLNQTKNNQKNCSQKRNSYSYSFITYQFFEPPLQRRNWIIYRN